MEGLNYVKTMALTSSRYGLPAFTTSQSLSPEEPTRDAFRQTDETEGVVLRLYINELPKARVSSIEDAFELSQDGAILEFREELAASTRQLASGELDARKISKRIERAKKILRLTKRADVIGGGVVTFLGLPGLLLPPLGVAATFGGVGIFVAGRYLRKRYGWALVSARQDN